MAVTADVSVGEDKDLVAAVRQGDDRAFEVLYGRYHARIAAYVRGMVKDHARAEDVTQEVFFSALRRMRETERPIAFKPWVYEIARNACIDSYRRTSRAEELSYDADDSLGASDHLRLVSSTPEPDVAVESKQRLDDLCGAFGGLSETHHKILVLRELEGLSYREIGEQLSMSRPAVESTLFRARRRLTEEYDELVSGRRCERVQAIIAAAAEGLLGARDRRKLARHTATCQVCRRHARRLGVDEVTPQTAGAKLAAVLPIPAFLRRGSEGAGAAGSHGSNLAAQVTSTFGAMADPMAALGWGKALAAAATLAFAGAGVAAHEGHPLPGMGNLPIVGKNHPNSAQSAARTAANIAVRSLQSGTLGTSDAVGATGSGGVATSGVSFTKGAGRAGDSATSNSARAGAAGGGASDDSMALPAAGAPEAGAPGTPGAPGAPSVDGPTVPPVDGPPADTQPPNPPDPGPKPKFDPPPAPSTPRVDADTSTPEAPEAPSVDLRAVTGDGEGG